MKRPGDVQFVLSKRSCSNSDNPMGTQGVILTVYAGIFRDMLLFKSRYMSYVHWLMLH